MSERSKWRAISDWRISLKGAPVQNYQTVAPNSNPRGEFASDTPGPAGG
jgi:hypothetical protein